MQSPPAACTAWMEDINATKRNTAAVNFEDRKTGLDHGGGNREGDDGEDDERGREVALLALCPMTGSWRWRRDSAASLTDSSHWWRRQSGSKRKKRRISLELWMNCWYECNRNILRWECRSGLNEKGMNSIFSCTTNLFVQGGYCVFARLEGRIWHSRWFTALFPSSFGRARNLCQSSVQPLQAAKPINLF